MTVKYLCIKNSGSDIGGDYIFKENNIYDVNIYTLKDTRNEYICFDVQINDKKSVKIGQVKLSSNSEVAKNVAMHNLSNATCSFLQNHFKSVSEQRKIKLQKLNHIKDI